MKTTRGDRMKINGSNPINPAAPVAAAAPAAPVTAPAEIDRASAAESALLKPARDALAALPDDIDAAKVAELRDALARGEIKFDAGRLAALIQRYHGGKA
ncbi:flagellar biosynthesis anti-sigma factor FlgM [Paucibacter sp. R3-3]|uniref:Flagellar biosynthesis anti-sigma factor FlgM n=1 Tax=Roseateles agri TaxID=3098619 RepID=A0ABU5DM94_9BURK|nr:flagellar biosynthesis anti-sigma factor FlgM [Paucibacter sp. R3-3]MDY0747427.1 flagellar biosynthesis anti-sigma factor FlgM [Paucibacter sp. R3-3]